MKTLQPLAKDAAIAAFREMRHPHDFRPFVPKKLAAPELNSSRRDRLREVMAIDHIQEIDAYWNKLYGEPFRGITSDGKLIPGLRKLEPNDPPAEAMIAAANALLDACTNKTRDGILFPVEAREWRRWHNMPMQWERDGYSVEDMNDAERQAVLGLIKASVSPEGYKHVIELMRINRFSGDLVGRPKYLNEWSYQFGLFGAPSRSEPWGWQIFGHHLAINVLMLGDTMVMSPTFLAAEPSIIDEGPHVGVEAFMDNERSALALIRGLRPDLRERAILYPSILNDDVPKGRRHWADSLHLAGAFQDNRVIPNEGVCGAEMTDEDRRRLMALLETFFLLLPPGPKKQRMAEIQRHLDETWFAWAGAYDDWLPFYLRIQSPVVLVELDQHGAVFLTNEEPARFHVHTIARTPNGGDYGRDLLAQYKARTGEGT